MERDNNTKGKEGMYGWYQCDLPSPKRGGSWVSTVIEQGIFLRTYEGVERTKHIDDRNSTLRQVEKFLVEGAREMGVDYLVPLQKEEHRILVKTGVVQKYSPPPEQLTLEGISQQIQRSK